MGSTLTVDNIVGATTAANVKLPAGCIVQVLDATGGETTASATSQVTLITTSFTPKYSGSKIFATVSIPNITGNNTYDAAFRIYIGNDSTLTSNSVFSHSKLQALGTGADNVQCFSATSAPFTTANTNTVYVGITGQPEDGSAGTWAFARHSATSRMKIYEVIG
jgi:hypothetical protein